MFWKSLGALKPPVSLALKLPKPRISISAFVLQVMDRKRPPPAREPSPERSGQTLSPPPRKRNRPDSVSLSPAPLAEPAATSKETAAKAVENVSAAVKRASHIGEEVTDRHHPDERRSARDGDRRRDSDRIARPRDSDRRSDRREYERERYSDRRERRYDDRRDRYNDDRRDRYRDDRRERERHDRDRRDDRDRRRDGDRHYKRPISPARPARDTSPSSR